MKSSFKNSYSLFKSRKVNLKLTWGGVLIK